MFWKHCEANKQTSNNEDYPNKTRNHSTVEISQNYWCTLWTLEQFCLPAPPKQIIPGSLVTEWSLEAEEIECYGTLFLKITVYTHIVKEGKMDPAFTDDI